MSENNGSSGEPVIQVRDLSKTYRVHEREEGFLAALKSLTHRRFVDVPAVERISFDVRPGEVVAFLGPNGAGKTTSIKMLTGLLYPSGGEARVLGYTPFDRKKELLSQITLVMGRRNQLIWDVPAIESFEFFRAMYGIPRDQYRTTLDELTDLMDVGPVLKKPARNLSLGERMKCELVAALLHRPRVLFLDEPTVGLDLVAQHRFRAYIASYNRRYEATVMLTSHYVPDVEELCSRAIFIHDGCILFDGSLAELAERLLPHKTIWVSLEDDSADLDAYGEVVGRDNGRVALRVPKADVVGTTERLVTTLRVKDLTIKDPPMEDLIKHVYTQGFTSAHHPATQKREWRRPAPAGVA